MPCITELFLQTITERPLKIPNGGQCISPPVGVCDMAPGPWGQGTQGKAAAIPEQIIAKGLVVVSKSDQAKPVLDLYVSTSPIASLALMWIHKYLLLFLLQMKVTCLHKF